MFTVTPPPSGLTAGPVALVAKATYQTPNTSGTQTLQSGVTVEVPYSSVGPELRQGAGITDDGATASPSPNFEGFDGAGARRSRLRAWPRTG